MVFGVADDVITECKSWRVGDYRRAEVLFKGVVWKLQALLGAVRPKLLVHAVVDSLAILVDTSPPVIVPKATDLILFLKADNLWHFFDFALQILEGTELHEAARSRPNDRDSSSGGR